MPQVSPNSQTRVIFDPTPSANGQDSVSVNGVVETTENGKTNKTAFETKCDLTKNDCNFSNKPPAKATLKQLEGAWISPTQNEGDSRLVTVAQLKHANKELGEIYKNSKISRQFEKEKTKDQVQPRMVVSFLINTDLANPADTPVTMGDPQTSDRISAADFLAKLFSSDRFSQFGTPARFVIYAMANDQLNLDSLGFRFSKDETAKLLTANSFVRDLPQVKWLAKATAIFDGFSGYALGRDPQFKSLAGELLIYLMTGIGNENGHIFKKLSKFVPPSGNKENPFEILKTELKKLEDLPFYQNGPGAARLSQTFEKLEIEAKKFQPKVTANVVKLTATEEAPSQLPGILAGIGTAAALGVAGYFAYQALKKDGQGRDGAPPLVGGGPTKGIQVYASFEIPF